MSGEGSADWVLGLDLGERSAGALAFAQWFTKGESLAGGAVVPVHVVERRYRSPHDNERVEHDLAAARLAAAKEDMAVHGLPDNFWSPIVLEADDAAEELGEEVRRRNAKGLIVGRRAPGGEFRWVSLGRTARRVCRQMPATVMVVGPDWSPPAGEGGPVLFVTDFGEHSREAAKFARERAEASGRGLLVLHVDRVPLSDFEIKAAGAAGTGDPNWWRDDEWLAAAQLADARVELATGSVVQRTVEVAERENASLIVVGSRRLTLADRIFSSSVGTELACVAKSAVAIVPPAD